MRQLVYDGPTRVFHWLFATLFLTAFAIGKIYDHDSSQFAYHMLAGLTLGFLVLLRVIWGFVGTRHAKFSNFALHPRDLLGYFKGILQGSTQLWAGHNPASSWAGLAMMVLALLLVMSGYKMVSGPEQEILEEVHEIFGNIFILIVIFHLLGLVFHTVRHREVIALSMLDGRKANVPAGETIPRAHGAVAVLLLAVVTAFGLQLLKSYDPKTQTLDLAGQRLQLGEAEEGEGHHHGDGQENEQRAHEDHEH